MKVSAVDCDKPVGRIEFRADEKSLTPYAGLAVVGALARRLGLVELIDAELGGERRAAPRRSRRAGAACRAASWWWRWPSPS